MIQGYLHDLGNLHGSKNLLINGGTLKGPRGPGVGIRPRDLETSRSHVSAELQSSPHPGPEGAKAKRPFSDSNPGAVVDIVVIELLIDVVNRPFSF